MAKSDLLSVLSMLVSLSTTRSQFPSRIFSRSCSCFASCSPRGRKNYNFLGQGSYRSFHLSSQRIMEQDNREVKNFGSDFTKDAPKEGTDIVTEYQETTADRDTRLVFETFPFQNLEYIIDSMIGNPDSVTPPLRRVQSYSTNNTVREDSDVDNGDEDPYYSRLFVPLFGSEGKKYGQDNQHIYKEQQLTTAELQRKKKGRQNFKISVAYRGINFCGWQIQPNHPKPSVQQTLMDILDPLLRQPASSIIRKSKKEKFFKKLHIKVCGRTDAGVSAISQVCRVRTFQRPEEVNAARIQSEINGSVFAENGSLRCVNVEPIDEGFHPVFSAKCRAYAYLIDLHNDDDDDGNIVIGSAGSLNSPDCVQKLSENHLPILNAMLQRLEGVELDYYSMSYGKVETATSLCTLYRSRASLVELTPSTSPGANGSEESITTRKRAICIELVGNRFLRRMVRILVATVVREALDTHRESQRDSTMDPIDVGSTKLLSIISSKERRNSAKASPPNGLIFVGAEFRRGSTDSESS